MVRVLVVTICVFSFCHSAIGQQASNKGKDPDFQRTVKLPVFAKTTITSTVSVPDGGVFVSGGGLKYVGGVRVAPRRRSSRELLAAAAKPLPTHLQSQVCSKVTAEGVTTYDIIHEFKPLKIEVYESGRIEMTIVRHYDENSIDALESDHPEVAMHVSAIPSSSPDGSKIQMSLDIESTITAENTDDLKERYPQIHEIYRQYTVPAKVTQSK